MNDVSRETGSSQTTHSGSMSTRECVLHLSTVLLRLLASEVEDDSDQKKLDLYNEAKPLLEEVVRRSGPRLPRTFGGKQLRGGDQ